MGDRRTFEILGSNEFQPWSAPVDRHTLSRVSYGDGSVVVLPTAAAPDGDDALETVGRDAVAHFTSLGLDVNVLPLHSRQDAFREDLVAQVSGPSMVFLSGGHPAYLAGALVDTPLWRRVVDASREGVAIGGCSAGAWVLGEIAPDSSAEDLSMHRWDAGLRVLPRTVCAPHWNRLDTFIQGLQASVIAHTPDEWVLIALDDRTAIVGDGNDWQVFGEGNVSVKYRDVRWTFVAETHSRCRRCSTTRLRALRESH